MDGPPYLITFISKQSMQLSKRDVLKPVSQFNLSLDIFRDKKFLVQKFSLEKVQVST